MLSLSHTSSGSNILKRLSVTVAFATSAVLLASCSSNSVTEVDVSAEGQTAYACALAEHVHTEHGAPESWANFIGDETGPGAREVSSVGALTMGAENDGFSDIGEQLIEGTNRVDIEALSVGLDAMQDACDRVEGIVHADVSHDGQLEYACALARRITEMHGDAASWVSDADATAWSSAVSVSALTGAMNGQRLAGHEALSDAGRNLLSALNRLDAEHANEGLEEFQSACSDL